MLSSGVCHAKSETSVLSVPGVEIHSGDVIFLLHKSVLEEASSVEEH